MIKDAPEVVELGEIVIIETEVFTLDVLFIAYGTGGAEAFAELKKALIEPCYEFVCISKFAANKLKDCKLISEDDVLKLIETERPKLVVNERSNGLEVQNRITAYCKENSIYNISLLDLHGSYDVRFTSMPDLITVPAESILVEMIAEGFDKEQLVLCGNPAFDRLKKMPFKERNNILEILFVSQPLTSGVDPRKLVSELDLALKEYNLHYRIYVKLHPQEKLSDWNFNSYANVKHLEFDNSKDFIPEIFKYDAIAGYDSTLQIQADIAKFPNLYCREGEIKESVKLFLEGKELKRHKHCVYANDATANVANVVRLKLEEICEVLKERTGVKPK